MEWASSEELFLKNNYEDKGVVFCSKELGRSTSSVANKAKRMGLSVIEPFKRRTKSHRDYEDQLFEDEIDYFPVEVYVNARTPILHECINGHRWKVTPNKILTKSSGCPSCAAYTFDPNKPAYLYFISFQADTLYYKIGITNREVKDRFRTDWDKYSMKIEWSILYEKGIDAYNEEQSILTEYSDYLINTGLLKSGNTETLSVYVQKRSYNGS